MFLILAAVVAVVVFVMTEKTTVLKPIESAGDRAIVWYRQRANGVNPRLTDFLNYWEENGEFDIMVAPNGGLRTDPSVQLKAFNAGNSKAKTLRETPHGRGAALDLWPINFVPSTPIEMQPAVKSQFEAIGEVAEAFGLTWGGHWHSFVDLPHIEIPNWQNLPYPPKVNS